MNHTAQTLDYYNRDPESFVNGTLAADMSDTQSRFIACLSPGSLILDFGCGSGRDTKAFLDAGFRVEATDGSEKLCELASAYTGISVKHALFGELDAISRYDGVWACASILHLPRNELADVIRKIEAALKPEGVLYASFRYGDLEGIRTERYFTDFTEETLDEFWKPFSGLKIFDTWITEDVRPDRKGIKWINLLARRE